MVGHDVRTCCMLLFAACNRQRGFFLPLSGGIDSTATACIVASMCTLVLEACQQGNKQVISDLQRIMDKDSDYIPQNVYTPFQTTPLHFFFVLAKRPTLAIYLKCAVCCVGCILYLFEVCRVLRGVHSLFI